MKKLPTKKSVTSSPLDHIPERASFERALGALVMRLSFAHFILELNLCSILGIDAEKGRILTQDLPFKSLLNRFSRAFELRAPEPQVLKQMKKLLKDLEDINDQRNSLVHAFWTFPDDGSPLVVPKKGKIASVKALPLNEILELVDATDRFPQEFFESMNRFNNPHLYTQSMLPQLNRETDG